MEPKISIIVPVYNVEQYLERCVESLMNQSYKNIELLLINDGSTDSSAEICREYLHKDKRCYYFEKENGGLSSARNIGIERSIGTYLTFVDSSYLETLYELMIKYNVDVSTVYYGAYDEERAYEYGDEYENVYSGRKVVEQLPQFEGGDSKLQTSWCILSKRELFDQITFLAGRIKEDIGTNYKLFMQVKK